MIFFSLLTALMLEHWRPIKPPFVHYQVFAKLSALLHDKLDGGDSMHGVLAWGIAVLPVLLVVALVQWWLTELWAPLAWGWSVLVLYFTTGFKYYATLAEETAAHLRDGELLLAQEKLDQWQAGHTQFSAASDEAAREAGAEAIASLTIERLFAHSLRQTFGIVFWFVLLGSAGAVLYRLASILSRRWQGASPEFFKGANRAFHVLNWLPARLTALTYAVAGNFEDAMYCWRTQSESWLDQEEGVVLSAGAGAMGVKLGQPVWLAGLNVQREEIGMGDAPDADQIDSAVSMVWRGILVWLIAGLLMALAGWAN